MEKIFIKESVRNLVEFLLTVGDIDNRFSKSSRAVEGIRAHQKLQEDNSRIYKKYDKEVYLSHEFELEKSIIRIEGRADGIIIENDEVIIEEIKSTYRKFDYIDESNEVHWAQAKVYAYIYAIQNGIDKINIRLSYVQLDNYEVKSFEKTFLLDELKNFTFGLLNEYEKFSIFISEKRNKRNASIKDIRFPFEEYRKGQRKLANTCYFTIKEKEKLFIQAPTGIGKTISTIFPSVKAIGEELGERIIYLTPKTINRKVAEDAFEKLRKEGLEFSTITLTAKEKSCCNSTFECNPESCKYAKGYFDRVRNAIYFILENEKHISLDKLHRYAEKYELCPFELGLDLSMYCDGIICDYNYVLDPRVSLTRLCESSGNIVLIDEAHNLIDRSRSMYSCTLSKSKILECKKYTKGKLGKMNSVLTKLNKYFIDLRNECEEKNTEWFYEKDQPKDIKKLLGMFVHESEEILARGSKFEGYDVILDLYFDINSFNSIMQLYDENYVTTIERDGSGLNLSLFCVNPSKNIKEYLDKADSVICFSATLTPLKYYIDMLGGEEESYRLKLPSPFDKEKLKVLISPLDIRYSQRMNTLKSVCSKIISFVNEVKGNYIIFSPSYAYMNLILEEIDREKLNEFKIIKQESNMSEDEKLDFINTFKSERNILGFCVIGGMFSEGIDLPHDELIGSVIIGVGYPKISMNNEIIKEFFGDIGYDYAYVYPGVNKVEQAAGRVIRTEEDEGRVLLIDNRYITNKYSILLPHEWYPIIKY